MDHLIHDGLHLWASGVQRANTHFGHRQQDERGGPAPPRTKLKKKKSERDSTEHCCSGCPYRGQV